MITFSKCLKCAFEDLAMHPERKLMKGIADGNNPSHFWTEDEVYIYDMAADTITDGYSYRGIQVDQKDIINELKESGIDIETARSV